MIIDIVSDLHGFYPKLHDGDLLIVAGDLTARDEPEQHVEFSEWLDAQAYNKKVVIAGNHDNNIDADLIECLNGCYYLEDSGMKICDYEHLENGSSSVASRRDFKVWGCPWTLKFDGMNPHCMAFTCDTEEELASKFSLIPEDIDILICHSPMWGLHDGPDAETRYGSKSLLKRHVTHQIMNLKLFVCGHIHEGYGIYDIREAQKALGDPIGCVHVNASHVDRWYRPVNKPIRVIL